MSTKTAKDYAKDYTKPKLREKLKEQIKQDDKGGKSGEWSARKSQLLNKAYEQEGGGYKHDGKPTASQKDLHQWSKEDWQTMNGDKAIRANKTKRYLPKNVWDKMSDEEKQQAEQDKEKASKKGKQYSKNPASVQKKLVAEHKASKK